jgi:hypothetical protein
MFDCEACGGQLEFLGELGNMAHFRCRQCGLAQHRPASCLEPDDDILTEEEREMELDGPNRGYFATEE